MKKRIPLEVRKRMILQHALLLAEKKQYWGFTRAQLANAADVSEALITYCFKNMKMVQSLVIQEAIKYKNIKIIMQGIRNNHPTALTAPKILKDKAIKNLLRDFEHETNT